MENPFNYEGYVTLSKEEKELAKKNFKKAMDSIGITTTDIPTSKILTSESVNRRKEVWIIK